MIPILNPLRQYGAGFHSYRSTKNNFSSWQVSINFFCSTLTKRGFSPNQFIPSSFRSQLGREKKARVYLIQHGARKIKPAFQNYKSLFSSSRLGSLTLGGYFLAHIDKLCGPVYAEEDKSRAVAISDHTPNDRISDLNDLGLKEVKRGWFEIKPQSRFKATLSKTGQLLWKSFERVWKEDIEQIVEFYQKLGPERAVHVNVGLHGDKDGVAYLENAGNFPVEDIKAFSIDRRYNSVSFFIPSNKYKEPFTHEDEDTKNVDIIDAWCFSYYTKDFTYQKKMPKTQESIVLGFLNVIFEFFKREYRSPVIPGPKYVEFRGLISSVEECLEQQSFCYIGGIGGMGKSRTARELSQKIEKSGSNSEYLNTLFISLKSQSFKDSFFRHVRTIVRHSGSPEEQLNKYFNLIGTIAIGKKKKVFITVDNIDSPEDLAFLETVYNSLRSFQKEQKGLSPFKLLVTGRRDLSKFLVDNQLDPKKNVVKIEEYCKINESIWELFKEIFLNGCQEEKLKVEAEKLLNEKKKELLEVIDQYGNHPGFTIVFANRLRISLTFHRFKEYFKLISKNFKKLIEEEGALSDYDKLCKIVKVDLDIMDKKYKGHASEVYKILSLVSDGSVNYNFLSEIIDRYYAKKQLEQDPPIDEIDENVLNDILLEFEDTRLLTRNRSDTQNYLEVPKFYNKILRSQISDSYEKKKKEVDSLISIILDLIIEDKYPFSENMLYLLSLFNYAFDANLMYEEVSEKAVKYVSERLHAMTYSGLVGQYNHFLSEISGNKPGYLLNPAIVKFISNKKDMDSMASDVMARLKKLEIHENSSESPSSENSENLLEFFKQLKTLNNLYVFKLNQGKPKLNQEKSELNQEKKLELDIIKNKLKKRLGYLKAIVDKEGISSKKQTIQNIQNNLQITDKSRFSDAYVFPEIEFHKVSKINRKVAQNWRDKHMQKGDETANLRGCRLDDGLRTLIYYLLEETKTKTIDLSHNSLGLNTHDTHSVSDLLRYPGTLITLKLNNNSLHTEYTENKSNFDILLKGLAANTTLETLYFNNNSLGDSHIRKLCKSLEDHKKITHIKLHHNKFGPSGIEELENLMKKNPRIKTITTHIANDYGIFNVNRHNALELVRGQNGTVKIITAPKAKL